MSSPTTLEAATAEIERLTRETAEQLEVIVHLQTDVIELKAENERLRDAKRRALAIADERSKENVELRKALRRGRE
jgi:hypothetical protein